MNTAAWEKRLLLHLPYGVIGLAAAKLSEAWRLSAGTDFSAKFLHLRDGVAMAFRNGLHIFTIFTINADAHCACWYMQNAGMPRSIGTAKNTALPAGESQATLRRSLTLTRGTTSS